MLIFYLSLIDTQEEKSKFEQLYYAYRKLMKAVARDILGDDAAAEDAVHDAFLKIIPNLQKVSEINCQKTKAYMVTIVRNVSINLYNKRKRQATRSLDESIALPAEANCTLESFSLQEIVSQIEKLPDKYRDILLYRYLYDHTDKEIAKLLDISQAAVYKRAERAKRMLAQLLQED